MTPIPYHEQVIYEGPAYRLVFMTPQGTIRPEDPLVRYRFGIVRLENKSDLSLWVRPQTSQVYAGIGYSATIGTGNDRRLYEPNYDRGQRLSLTGPDESDPFIVPPGHSLRMASYFTTTILRLVGAFGFGEEGRPLVGLDRICPQFEGRINVQFATASGQASNSDAGSPPAGLIEVSSPCYSIDNSRDWDADWDSFSDYKNTLDTYPDWEPYPTPR